MGYTQLLFKFLHHPADIAEEETVDISKCSYIYVDITYVVHMLTDPVLKFTRLTTKR